jgi:hypothetical protein
LLFFSATAPIEAKMLEPAAGAILASLADVEDDRDAPRVRLLMW